MKKTLLLFVITLLSIGASYAQNESKGFLGFTLGLGSAGGQLAEAPVQGVSDANNFPGYAGGGFELGMHGAYHLHKYIGLGGKLSITGLSGDATKLKEANDNTARVTNTSVENWAYAAISLMVGPRGKIDVSDNVELFLMPQIGVSSFGASPQKWSYTPNGSFSTVRYTNEYTYGGGFAWGVSGGLRTKGKVGFLLDINYTDLGKRNASVSIKGENGFSTQSTKLDIKQQISWFMINAGIAFKL